MKITVRDTGIGIPRERLQQVAEMMENPLGKGRMKTGLAVSNLIAEALGGESLCIKSS